MQESSIQTKILSYLRKRRDVACAVKLTDLFNVGYPDIHALWNGRPVYFEVKTATGRVSLIQRAVLDRLERAGALVAVVRSVADVEAFFLSAET